MKHLRTILTVTAALTAAVTLQAQTYNDTVRTHTWSVYVQGGASSYHEVRSELFDHSKRTIAPDLNLGVKYNLKPWVRLGANAGYTQLKSTDKTILSSTVTDNNYLIGDHIGTLEVQSDRLQNRNNAHLLGLDINADFNILGLWPRRKAQWLNLYAGAGLGYTHGWNRNSQTWVYNEEGIAKGDGYNNVYTHAYMESSEAKKQFNAFYVPLSLSLEFDVQRQLTIGVTGQYKYMPTKAEFTPKGVYSAGIVVRYNFVKSKSHLQQKQIADLYRQLDAARAECANEKAALQSRCSEEMAQLRKESDGLKHRMEEIISLPIPPMKGEACATVYFDNNSSQLSAEGSEQLKHFAGQLSANPEKKILLISSASASGGSGRNKKLSDSRLKAVKRFLLDHGVSDIRFKSETSLGDRGMTETSDCRRVIVVTQP